MFEAWFVPLWDGTPRPVLAAVLGAIAFFVSLPLIRHCLVICGAPPKGHPWGASIATGLLVAAFSWLMLQYDVQRISEVRPLPVMDRLLIVHHGVLLVLVAAATATDWKTCYIPDVVTTVGLILGILVASVSGDAQIAHVWVDWNQEIPNFQGPWIPGWLSMHPHLHGLAWSVAGAACGAALTSIVRVISRWALGAPALGSGDVWLLAMVGSYLGWQATIITFLLAPILALIVGLPLKMATSRPYIPYGPFLSAAAAIVMFTWRWIWMLEWNLGSALPGVDRRTTFAVRRLFGDPVALLAIGGVVIVALAAMLGWKRWQSGWDVSSRLAGVAGAGPSEAREAPERATPKDVR
jgi:leader peptidase (prepilin peptidase) / N-methyltransferase